MSISLRHPRRGDVDAEQEKSRSPFDASIPFLGDDFFVLLVS